MQTRLPIYVLFAVAAALPAQHTGEAVFYSDRFAGKPMANGQRFDQSRLTASHASFPFGGQVRVTDLDTGASVVVEVTDRPGPKTKEVVILTRAAAERLDFIDRGRARVRLELIGRAERTDELRPVAVVSEPAPVEPVDRAEAIERSAREPDPRPPAERTPVVQRPPREPLPAGRKPSPFSLSEPN